MKSTIELRFRMPAKKMRVELFDGEGNKYTVAFEGQITRDKALRVLDLMELLGGMPASTQAHNTITAIPNLSKYDKVRALLQKRFPIVWFTSREVQAEYEKEFHEPIGLSTVATYLSRMTDRGLLLKTGASNRAKYKVMAGIQQAVVKQQI